MIENAFAGKPQHPTDEEVAAEMGKAKALWDELAAELAKEHQVEGREWMPHSKNSGWSLRLKRRDRNIVYLSPCRGWFLASFVLGGRAVEAARASALPKKVIAAIDGAKRYAEGTGVRIEVRNAKDLAAVKLLAGIKLKY